MKAARLQATASTEGLVQTWVESDNRILPILEDNLKDMKGNLTNEISTNVNLVVALQTTNGAFDNLKLNTPPRSFVLGLIDEEAKADDTLRAKLEAQLIFRKEKLEGLRALVRVQAQAIDKDSGATDGTEGESQAVNIDHDEHEETDDAGQKIGALKTGWAFDELPAKASGVLEDCLLHIKTSG